MSKQTAATEQLLLRCCCCAAAAVLLLLRCGGLYAYNTLWVSSSAASLPLT